ncbi:MAG: cache domain-containing protein, partial [Pseudomonadota bacterium]
MWRIYLSFVGLVLAGAVGLYWASYSYFKAQDLATAKARLSLYQSTVEAELQRFRHLPFVLSVDTVVQQALKDRDTEVLNRRLASFAQRAGLDAIYVMDPTGLTIAASNAGTSSSFVGQNYSFRPYFQAAKEGRQGEFYGIGATTGIPGYFFAEAVQTPGVGLAGVVAIKINLSTLQTSWQEAGEGIIL